MAPILHWHNNKTYNKNKILWKYANKIVGSVTGAKIYARPSVWRHSDTRVANDWHCCIVLWYTVLTKPVAFFKRSVRAVLWTAVATNELEAFCAIVWRLRWWLYSGDGGGDDRTAPCAHMRMYMSYLSLALICCALTSSRRFLLMRCRASAALPANSMPPTTTGPLLGLCGGSGVAGSGAGGSTAFTYNTASTQWWAHAHPTARCATCHKQWPE